MGGKYTEAQNKATQKYIKNAYDTIPIRVPKGKREIYKQRAEAEGKSLNQYIVDCVEKGRE
jgi:predicted HicB family RNase H-like nuclease